MIRYLHIGMTSACNLNCKHCFVKDKHIYILDENKVIQLIGFLERQGLTHIYYTYGEPLIYKNIFSLSAAVNRLGIYQVLMTNGTLISEDVADRLKSSGFNRIMVSIDSADPQIHDENRGQKGSFCLAVKAIELLKQRDINVGIATTVTEKNCCQLAVIEKLAQQHSISYISFLACRDHKLISCPLDSSYIQFFKSCVVQNKQYAFHDIRLNEYLNLWVKTGEISEAQYNLYYNANLCCKSSTLTFSPSGDIFTCDLVDTFSLGNINEINSYESMSDIIDLVALCKKGCCSI